MESVQKNKVNLYILMERSLRHMVENSKLWNNTCSMMPFILKIRTIKNKKHVSTWSITQKGDWKNAPKTDIGYLWGAKLD